jgi:hypothetical protein
MASRTVNDVFETAVKNILMHNQMTKKTDPDTSSASTKHKRGGKSGSTPSKLNPYTDTKVSIATRSHSITYKHVQASKERSAKKNNAETENEAADILTTPVKNNVPAKSEVQNDLKSQSDKLTPLKEPHKPKEGGPTGFRKPSVKQRQQSVDVTAKRKASKSNDHSVRKSSEAVVEPTESKRSAVNRKYSMFRKPDPVPIIKNVANKISDVSVKNALRRVSDIMEMLSIDIPES